MDDRFQSGRSDPAQSYTELRAAFERSIADATTAEEQRRAVTAVEQAREDARLSGDRTTERAAADALDPAGPTTAGAHPTSAYEQARLGFEDRLDAARTPEELERAARAIDRVRVEAAHDHDTDLARAAEDALRAHPAPPTQKAHVKEAAQVEHRVVAFVGTREPSPAQIERCQEAVRAALEAGWSIVTGGAPGIDHVAVTTAQKLGHAERVTLVLPWENFENWKDQRLHQVIFDPKEHPEHAAWLVAAKATHAAPDQVKPTVWPLLARNVGIVEMADTVFAFPQVVDGRPRGGTAHDISVAKTLDRDLWVDAGTRPAGTPWREAMTRQHIRGQSRIPERTPEPRSRTPEQPIVVNPKLFAEDREAWLRQQIQAAEAARALAHARHTGRETGQAAPAATRTLDGHSDQRSDQHQERWKEIDEALDDPAAIQANKAEHNRSAARDAEHDQQEPSRDQWLQENGEAVRTATTSHETHERAMERGR